MRAQKPTLNAAGFRGGFDGAGADAPRRLPKPTYIHQTMMSWQEFMLSLPSFGNLVEITAAGAPANFLWKCS